MNSSHRALHAVLVLLLSCDHSAPPDTASGAQALPSALTTSTWSTIQARIAADARSFQRRDGVFEARLPRRHQVSIDERGAILSNSGHELAIELAGYGRADNWTVTEPVEPILGSCAEGTPRREGCIRRVEQPREALTEWWVGRSTGLQQGWTLENRVEGSGHLFIEVAFEGAFVTMDGEDASIISAD